MRVAIIGLGVIGKVHAEIIRKQAELVAVCDIDTKTFVGFDDCEKFIDYREMIDKIMPDVVHVCTPHYLHAEMVIYSLNKNVNVFCEKPLCTNFADLDAILNAEKLSSAQLGVCLQNRYTPINKFIKEFTINNPPISAMANVTWCRDKDYYAQAEWRGKWNSEGGGVLINQALHTLDILQWICGYPERLTAITANLTLKREIEVEDTACVLCKGKVPFTFYATNGSSVNFHIEITICTKNGIIRANPNMVIVDDEIVETNLDLKYYGKKCYGSGHDLIIPDFYSCILNKQKFPIDGKEGAKVLKLILSAYQSKGEEILL